MQHSFSLRLLQSCLELAIRLNYRGMECMELQWSFSLRDVNAAPVVPVPAPDAVQPSSAPASRGHLEELEEQPTNPTSVTDGEGIVSIRRDWDGCLVRC